MSEISGITEQGLNRDLSGGGDRLKLRKLGYEPKPVVTFGDNQYILLFYGPPVPGHNTAEVIDITRFNGLAHEDGSKTNFRIPVTTSDRRRGADGVAYVHFADEGMSVVAVYEGGDEPVLYDYTNPSTAVLSYRVAPPTREDARQVERQLRDELENSEISPRW